MKGLAAILVLMVATAVGLGCSCSRSDKHLSGPAASASVSTFSKPDPRLATRLESGVRRAVAYVRERADSYDPRLAMVLAYPQRKFALAELPSMAEHAATNDAGAKVGQFVRVFRRMVDPTTSVEQPTIDALVSDIDRITATALYCDRLGLPGDFVQKVTALTERADVYALPHAMMAVGWAIENGCLTPAATKSLHERQLVLVEAHMERRDAGVVGDALIESVVFLYYLGERSHVKDEWIDAVLDAQLSSGGWAGRGTSADDHTTTLALWLLLEAEHPDVPQVTWIARR